MLLELPDDARVQIFVAPAGTTSFIESLRPLVDGEPPAAFTPRKFRHPVLMGSAIVALIGLAFIAGQHTRGTSGSAPIAYAQSARRAPEAAPPATAELPADFREKLQQPPTITPPPGAAPAGAPGKSPFGLED
jgi:hypothetical protein